MLALLILLTSAFLFTALGCGHRSLFYCKITDGEEIVLEREYDVTFLQWMRIKKYRSLSGYYREKGGDEVSFLRSLNEELADDLEKLKERDEEKEEPDFLYLKDGIFTYTEGRSGRAASVDTVAAQLIERDGKFVGELPYRDVPPVYTVEDVKKHTQKIHSFSTDYSTSAEERKHNVELAADKLDGAVIEGRSELSFNDAVGKRTVENGYKEAIVISFGQFTQGIGGGVCQVSTTLYNAWVGAGLDAKSNNHSLTVSYVPIGLDAMVSEKSDLILVNQTDYPVFIDAFHDGKTLSFTLYGTPANEEIVLTSEKIATYPCDEYEIVCGEEEKVLSEPKDGYLYQSYREYYKDHRLVKREKLRTSAYRKVKGRKIIINKGQDE